MLPFVKTCTGINVKFMLDVNIFTNVCLGLGDRGKRCIVDYYRLQLSVFLSTNLTPTHKFRGSIKLI